MNKELEEAVETLNLIEEEDFAWYLDKNITEERIKAIKTISNYIENSIPKEELKKVIDEISRYEDIAREQIEEKIIIADSDSLNFGRKQAHGKDIEVLRRLLEGK